MMQTIRLTALIVFGLGTSAMADEIVPAEYQGVWAAAHDCKEIMAESASGRYACRTIPADSPRNTSAPTSKDDPRLGQPHFYRDEGSGDAWWTHAGTPGVN